MVVTRQAGLRAPQMAAARRVAALLLLSLSGAFAADGAARE